MNNFDRLKDSTFVVFDCETTGLDYTQGHQIIELAGQKVVRGEVTGVFHSLINPTVDVEEGAYRVHGLSNLYLAEHGKAGSGVVKEFLDFVNGSILVGHNILTFDIPFVNADLRRHGLAQLSNMVIDTLIMARKIIPRLPDHKLGTVAKHFNIDPTGAHRALKDVDMNREIFLKMLDQYLEKLDEEERKRTGSLL